MVEGSKPKLATFIKYAKVELAPPKISELPEVAAGIGRVMRSAKSGAWRHVTVRVSNNCRQFTLIAHIFVILYILNIFF